MLQYGEQQPNAMPGAGSQLAARGGSNRDIAEMIFVSRNTVAWHLRNVYRKLQIASREQLTRLVEA